MLRHFLKRPMAIAVALAAAPMASTTFAQQGSTRMLEEVTVTAQRREESLQDVPIAVSAISGDELSLRGLQTIDELAQSVPSLTLEPSRATNTTLTAFIRGVGQQDPLAGFEQGVALYLDDVYMARPQGALLDIYDVERIEVLRGPQGTLYGRNAVGGAIKYVTRRLSDETDLRLRASLGNYSQQDLVGTIAIPLSDDFRIGGTVAQFERDGFGDNRFTGGEQYDKDIFGYRFSAEWDLTDNILVRGSFDRTLDKSSAVAGYRPFAATTIVAEPIGDVWDTRAGASEQATGTTTGINGRNVVDASGWMIDVDWRLNDAMTLRSITAEREDFTESVIDFDSLSVPDFDAPVIYDNRQFSQEFQFLWNTDRISSVFGVFYLDATAANDFDVVLGQLVPGGLTAYTGGVVDTEAWSVFGDVTYRLTDRLSVAFGLRYTEDERSADIFRANYLGLQSPFFNNDNAVQIAVTSDYEASRTFTDTSPRINVAYALSDDMNVYATYSQGWKAGSFDPRGANFATPAVEQGYDPESLDAFEVGLKSTWMDGRAVTNVALFYSDYTDMQIPGSVGVDTDGDGVNDDFVGTVTNAGESEIYGLEIEGNVILTDALSAQFSGSFLSAEFKEYLVNGVDVSDQREIQNTPDTMLYVGANYDMDLFGGATRFNVNYAWKSEVAQFEIANEALDQESVGLLNASVVWTSSSDTWRVGLHGRNLTEEEVKVSGYCFGLGDGPGTPSACPSALGLENNVSVFYAPPMTVTGTIEYNL